GVLLGLKPGVGPKLVGGIPETLFKCRSGCVFFARRDPAHKSNPPFFLETIMAEYAGERAQPYRFFDIEISWLILFISRVQKWVLFYGVFWLRKSKHGWSNPSFPGCTASRSQLF